MTKLTKKALLKHLNKSDKEDIIREVEILFDKFKPVKEYYQAELLEGPSPVLESYKKKIAEAYAKPNPKEKTTNANLNRLITAFKKISIYDRDIADLMLCRVECGLAAIKKNNRRTPTFYNSVIHTFEEAVKLIAADDSISEFTPRVEKLLKNTPVGKYEISEKLNEAWLKWVD